MFPGSDEFELQHDMLLDYTSFELKFYKADKLQSGEQTFYSKYYDFYE